MHVSRADTTIYDPLEHNSPSDQPGSSCSHWIACDEGTLGCETTRSMGYRRMVRSTIARRVLIYASKLSLQPGSQSFLAAVHKLSLRMKPEVRLR